MEKLTGIDEIIYINLDRAKERMIKMEKILSKVNGIKITRFNAFDGKFQDVDAEISSQNIKYSHYTNKEQKSLVITYLEIFKYIVN